MRILVLSSNYPNNQGEISLNYVHVRNCYYKQMGHKVVELSFRAKEDYIKDDIPVFTLKSFHMKFNVKDFDVIVCHAANLRHHYRFLWRENKNINRIVFFYHGYEVMRLTDYPPDYPYKKKDNWKRTISPLYDSFKLKTWKRFILRNINKIDCVFVSEWMRDTFMNNLGIKSGVIPQEKIHIIYNSVSKKYQNYSWNNENEKKYDFVTIRGQIDTSKFAIDFVNDLALNNPQYQFLLVGRGEFFHHYKKAPNLLWINEYMNQDQIIKVLNESSCALMPTRLDAQGVMTCEMATFGIPVITSDIPVCRYVLKNFTNVSFIENDIATIDLGKVLSKIQLPCSKNTRFFEEETVQKELDLYNSLL